MTARAEEHLVCSAKGCRATATRGVVWRNPRLHTPERRKVWLACPDHERHLAEFVQLRGFLLEVVDVDELGAGDG
ncbi:hypothetical protein [Ornithinimicrobium sufpigmenti]|uniref:hypothetical protein n=1 Tax=Ornithinimicrobium sufpigmenti TaxID=2508882 RepID=UPI0010362B84|nr:MULTISPECIES: hypothetical protein [unclassified Ornithinimicrobium]